MQKIIKILLNFKVKIINTKMMEMKITKIYTLLTHINKIKIILIINSKIIANLNQMKKLIAKIYQQKIRLIFLVNNNKPNNRILKYSPNKQYKNLNL